jgi:flagellar basal-body rod modification protein FlgD
MAIIQQVENGQVVDTTSSTTSSTESSGSTLDQMDFINLLVAEMQYQDPLEPSSNTEYVAQLATFSQVEGIEDMKNTVSEMQANNLVGKYVSLNVTTSSGSTNTISGKVDYVQTKNDTTYLSIDGSLYSMDDLSIVADDDYVEASAMSSAFSSLMASLPSVNALTTSDSEDLTNARAVYDSMTDYQKSFVSSSDYQKLVNLETQMSALTNTSDT